MSSPQSSHAYGIGVMAVLIGMGAVIVFYTSFYLPEQMQKPSVAHEILSPSEVGFINIVSGAVIDNDIDYQPKSMKVILGVNNLVLWQNNDDTAHTVTPDHRYEDGYSGVLKSPGVIKSGETYEFLFTEKGEVHYHCEPHPWMKASIIIEINRF